VSGGELVLYTTEDGRAAIQLRAEDGTVWLTQAQMAELFDTTKQNVSLHLKNLFDDGELVADSVVKESLTTAADGKAYPTQHYRLEAILAVGYRVRSPRGIQFRRWATTVLQDYLVKGFAMDDARLKDPRADHFDDLLERIRDIRASEARFYQKLRDTLSLSADYTPSDPRTQTFYATIQNKMLFAVTNHTAAELIATRADDSQPNMGLTSFKGARVRKGDVGTAKNYLGDKELRELNLIVTMFLDAAELRASRRQNILLADWEGILDGFLTSNDLPILKGAGRMTKAEAESLAHQRYAAFDQRRKAQEVAEQASELDELKRIADIAAKALPKTRGRS
jgi:hypothetical protein